MNAMRLQTVVLLLSAVVITSCAIPPEAPTVPLPSAETPPSASATLQATYPRDLHGAELYRIDAAASSVNILAYRGGTMAKMGHNHVISSTSVTGYVWRHATAMEHSGFDLLVPVNELIVDDDKARTAQGDDFPNNLDEEAKRGTKSNMLSSALLDGAQFPFIAIKAINVGGTPAAPRVTARLQIKQQTQDVTLPVTVDTSGERLAVRGEFDLKQADFGLTPFTAAMGTLFVQDVIKVRFDLVALPAQP